MTLPALLPAALRALPPCLPRSLLLRGALLAASALCALLAPVPLAAEAIESRATDARARPAITVARLQQVDLRDVILTGGLIRAEETVYVSPLVEGQPIEALLAEVGQRVRQGEVIARLSPTTLELSRSQLEAGLAAAVATTAQAEAQVTDATAALEEAQRNTDRVLQLQTRGNASQAAADQARTAAISATARLTVARQSLEAARAQANSVAAQLANVKLNLERTEVRAPVSGDITARNAQIGAVASAAGAPMFTLMRDGALELRAELSARDLLRARPGQTVRLRLPGQAAPLEGALRLVEPVLDLTSRLGYARIALNAPEQARAGMYAEAEILVEARPGLALPVTAISSTPQGVEVLAVDPDGRVSRKTVETGIRDGALIEITAGLTEGETVVARAGAFVRPGDQIRPVELAAD